MRRRLFPLLLFLPLAACDVSPSEPFVRRTLFDGFEAGNLGDWTPDGDDLDDPPVTWSIEASTEEADEGRWSARLRLDNVNDQGKIWLERPVQFLVPGATYEVVLTFDFASADFGAVNLWRILAGVAPDDPESVAAFARGDTGNGTGSDDFAWSEKSFTITTQAGGAGEIWLVVGIWGTSEFARTYYVDDISVTITRVF